MYWDSRCFLTNNKESMCVSPKLNLSTKWINPNTERARKLLSDTERIQVFLTQEKEKNKNKILSTFYLTMSSYFHVPETHSV